MKGRRLFQLIISLFYFALSQQASIIGDTAEQIIIDHINRSENNYNPYVVPRSENED